MKKYFITIFIISFHIFAFAGENGGYAGSHLRIGLGARGIALGNSVIAANPDGYSVYYNPAAAGYMEGKAVSLSYSFMSLDRVFNYIGFSMKLPPEAGLSIGLINSGFRNIDSYTSIGVMGDEVNHNANLAFLNFSRKFGAALSLGLTIKYNWEYINDGSSEFDYSSQGIGWDFGILFKLNSDITFAAALRDVGSKFKANTSDLFNFGGTTIDKFPILYNMGGKYTTPLQWLDIFYTYQISAKKAQKHFIGAEAKYHMGKSLNDKNLALRLGFDNGRFTAGTGMAFNMLSSNSRLDYAFASSVVDEGSSHIFSWQFYF
jgi:hypothetical protein